MNNVNIRFINCILQQVFISDLQFPKESQISIAFYNSVLNCSEVNSCGMRLIQNHIAKCVFVHTYLSNFKVHFKTKELILILNATTILQPIIDVQARSHEYLKIPSIVKFIKVKIGNFATDSILSHNIILDITNPFVIMRDCVIVASPLAITSKRHLLDQTFLLILISHSRFINAFNEGNGGALSVQSEVPNSKMMVIHSTFVNNTARESESPDTESGGGLYVKANSLELTMDNCTFYDNKASKLGSAVYTSTGVNLSVHHCSFYDVINPHEHDLPPLVSVAGMTEHFTAALNIITIIPRTYVDTVTAIHIEAAKHLHVYIQCPKWHKQHVNQKSIMQSGQSLLRVTYECSPCADDHYIPSIENNTFIYRGASNGNSNNSNSIKPKSKKSKQKYCIKCPYGAVCIGNNVIPRPNYWGFWHKGELVFQQCPAGYCCSGGKSAPCIDFNSCVDKRRGNLCGACRENFSVSILTGKCLANTMCGKDQWFWLLAALASLAYALWYTLKDDIFFTCFSLINKKFKVLKSKLSHNIYALEKDIDIKLSHKIVENIDKGYFGILTYFVQIAAVMHVQIEFSDIDKSKSFLDKIVQGIGTCLNAELTQITFDVCPIIGLTVLGKHLYKCLFIINIFVSWFILFLLSQLKSLSKSGRIAGILCAFNGKLVMGLTEIIKYTYSGFCNVIFLSLVCVKLGAKSVWFYDGTNICYGAWQILMIIFGVCFAFPFPISLFYGSKLLKQNQISSATFVLFCLCPAAGLLYRFMHDRSKAGKAKARDNNELSESARGIISTLQGPYREDDKHMTLYWEAMVSFRRLLITAMTLIPFSSIRMVIISILNAIFLSHHFYLQPFHVQTSNYVEGLSLLFLTFVSMINGLKSFLTDSGVIPDGPIVPFLKSLELFEKLFVLIIIAYIMFIEFKRALHSRKSRSSSGKREILESTHL